jgi:hypothetical protein
MAIMTALRLFWLASALGEPQQRLYFFPLPQGQRSFTFTERDSAITISSAFPAKARGQIRMYHDPSMNPNTLSIFSHASAT